MAVIDLTQQSNASSNNNVVFTDEVLENDGANISFDTFQSAGDRIYDVRGFLGFFAQIINDSPVSINVEIDQSILHKDTSSLVDADFTVLVADAEVTTGTTSAIFELLRATPQITAIRIRLRLNAPGAPQTVNGVVSAN